MKRAVPFLFVLLPGMVPAQTPSHLNDLDQPALKDISKVLGGKAPGNGKLDNEMLRRLLGDVAKNIDPKAFDPKTFDPSKIDPKLVEQILKDNPGLRDPQNLERLKSLVQDQMKNPPPDFKMPKQDLQKVDEALKQIGEFAKKNSAQPDPQAEAPERSPQPQELPMPPNEQQRKRIEELSRFAKQVLGDSETTRDIIRDFAEIMNREGATAELASLLNGLGQEWRELGSPGGMSASRWNELLGGLQLPSVGSPGAPSVGGGLPHLTPDGGDTPNPQGEGSGSSTALLVVGALVLGALLFWKKIAGGGKEVEDVNSTQLRFEGDLDPRHVRSREDVVKVFDHISLTRLGEDAVNWHHRQIAGSLLSQAPDQKDSVVRLVDLYEKARYAPQREPFTESDIAEARQRLCQVAGIQSP